VFRTESTLSAPKLDLSAARYFGASDPQAMNLLELLRPSQEAEGEPGEDGGSA
jgi:hypothetical protein